MPKIAAPPVVALETWRALLAAAAEFAALEPWEFMFDSDPVGILDPKTQETRIAHVLGNAGQVFAAVFYRRAGVRWLLSVLSDSPDPDDLNQAEGMDCLKLEFVPKRELSKEDRAIMKAAEFEPAGKGCVWPQFRSSEPGWHPWHLNQVEADQLLSDLPRLTAFCRLFEEHPEAFDADRPATEIPVLREPLPNRLLTPQDLEWRPLLIPPPSGFEPFQASADELSKLRSLPRARGVAFEFDCTLVPAGSMIEQGRPCFGRYSLLVEQKRGLIVGMDVQSGGVSPGEAAGRGLAKALLMAKTLPEKLMIGGLRLQPVLQELCDKLEILLSPESSLPALDEALQSFGQTMLAAGGPHRL